MRPRTLLAAISPCPNDTFAFAPWIERRIDSPYVLDICFHDIEELNTVAMHSDQFDLIKISAACYGKVCDRYAVLSSGAAFALNGGPLLVAKRKSDFRSVAIPGIHTSAYAAYRLLYGTPQQVCQMSYEQIVPCVEAGVCDAGIVIHEGRFAIPSSLEIVADLGEAFAEKYGCPLPLGLIVAKRSLGKETISCVESILRKSVEQARLETLLSHWFCKRLIRVRRI